MIITPSHRMNPNTEILGWVLGLIDVIGERGLGGGSCTTLTPLHVHRPFMGSTWGGGGGGGSNFKRCLSVQLNYPFFTSDFLVKISQKSSFWKIKDGEVIYIAIQSSFLLIKIFFYDFTYSS